MFCARTTPSAGTCSQLDFSIIFDRWQLVFQLEDVNSKWLAICCYSGVPGIKHDLVTVGKLCFHFSHVLGGVVDCVNVNPSARTCLNYVLRDAQNVCALTKVGTVLNCHPNLSNQEWWSYWGTVSTLRPDAQCIFTFTYFAIKLIRDFLHESEYSQNFEVGDFNVGKDNWFFFHLFLKKQLSCKARSWSKLWLYTFKICFFFLTYSFSSLSFRACSFFSLCPFNNMLKWE